MSTMMTTTTPATMMAGAVAVALVDRPPAAPLLLLPLLRLPTPLLTGPLRVVASVA